jgi:hypothetical protein
MPLPQTEEPQAEGIDAAVDQFVTTPASDDTQIDIAVRQSPGIAEACANPAVAMAPVLQVPDYVHDEGGNYLATPREEQEEAFAIIMVKLGIFLFAVLSCLGVVITFVCTMYWTRGYGLSMYVVLYPVAVAGVVVAVSTMVVAAVLRRQNHCGSSLKALRWRSLLKILCMVEEPQWRFLCTMAATVIVYLVVLASILSLADPTELAALRAFKASGGAANDGVLATWTGDEPCHGGWVGVTCTLMLRPTVTELDLSTIIEIYTVKPEAAAPRARAPCRRRGVGPAARHSVCNTNDFFPCASTIRR